MADKIKTTEWRASEALGASVAEQLEYLAAAFEEGGDELFDLALLDVIEARKRIKERIDGEATEGRTP